MLLDTHHASSPNSPERDSAHSSSGALRKNDELTPIRPTDPDRAEVESYVRSAFLRRHGARLRSIMPELLAMRNQCGELCGVAGYRAAGCERLYLEQYLDQPIEAEISARAAVSVCRQTIVEIGGLACRDSASARRLMAQLPAFLLREGHLWVAFTATRTIRDLLRKLNAPALELCRADPARVATAGDFWGAYYENDPRVMVGFLPNTRSLPAFRV